MREKEETSMASRSSRCTARAAGCRERDGAATMTFAAFAAARFAVLCNSLKSTEAAAYFFGVMQLNSALVISATH